MPLIDAPVGTNNLKHSRDNYQTLSLHYSITLLVSLQYSYWLPLPKLTGCLTNTLLVAYQHSTGYLYQPLLLGALTKKFVQLLLRIYYRSSKQVKKGMYR